MIGGKLELFAPETMHVYINIGLEDVHIFKCICTLESPH